MVKQEVYELTEIIAVYKFLLMSQDGKSYLENLVTIENILTTNKFI